MSTGHHGGRTRGRVSARPASGHDHAGSHHSLWIARPHEAGTVHRVGRRRFLAELGRNTFAIAVLGGFAVACSSDDDATSVSEPDGEGTEAASDEETAPGTVAVGDRLRWAQANLGFVSAYVLVRGNEAVVVDTGNPGSTEQIGAALATVNATFDDVSHVVLTHSHGDHVGSLPAVLERAAGAVPYAGAADIPNISSPIDVVAVGERLVTPLAGAEL